MILRWAFAKVGEAEVEPKKVKMRWVILVARLLSQISDVGEMKFVVRDRLLLLVKAGSKHPYSQTMRKYLMQI